MSFDERPEPPNALRLAALAVLVSAPLLVALVVPANFASAEHAECTSPRETGSLATSAGVQIAGAPQSGALAVGWRRIEAQLGSFHSAAPEKAP